MTFQVLNDQTFDIMVLMALFTTFITTPLVVAVYKPAKNLGKAEYRLRVIQRKNTNTYGMFSQHEKCPHVD